ncbi:hypothetical protein B0H14DRAFT_3433465 [Mycena olivaceomarginata]|nr:hypothetical protein B0H14DRAFT_3433465 [Mycena olivaceomarginata]
MSGGRSTRSDDLASNRTRRARALPSLPHAPALSIRRPMRSRNASSRSLNTCRCCPTHIRAADSLIAPLIAKAPRNRIYSRKPALHRPCFTCPHIGGCDAPLALHAARISSHIAPGTLSHTISPLPSTFPLSPPRHSTLPTPAPRLLTLVPRPLALDPSPFFLPLPAPATLHCLKLNTRCCPTQPPPRPGLAFR